MFFKSIPLCSSVVASCVVIHSSYILSATASTVFSRSLLSTSLVANFPWTWSQAFPARSESKALPWVFAASLSAPTILPNTSGVDWTLASSTDRTTMSPPKGRATAKKDNARTTNAARMLMPVQVNQSCCSQLGEIARTVFGKLFGVMLQCGDDSTRRHSHSVACSRLLVTIGKPHIPLYSSYFLRKRGPLNQLSGEDSILGADNDLAGNHTKCWWDILLLEHT